MSKHLKQKWALFPASLPPPRHCITCCWAPQQPIWQWSWQQAPCRGCVGWQACWGLAAPAAVGWPGPAGRSMWTAPLYSAALTQGTGGPAGLPAASLALPVGSTWPPHTVHLQITAQHTHTAGMDKWTGVTWLGKLKNNGSSYTKRLRGKCNNFSYFFIKSTIK